jgi:hypothetical protein
MGRSILKLETPKGPRYLEYSSIVDAPITWGLTLEVFEQYYKEEYGQQGLNGLVERMFRVEMTGSSMWGSSLEETIRCNRAGLNGTELTIQQFTEFYGLDSNIGEQAPVGAYPEET